MKSTGKTRKARIAAINQVIDDVRTWKLRSLTRHAVRQTRTFAELAASGKMPVFSSDD